MDREQEEIQFLGFSGIFKESFKIIILWRKIFTQITLSLILPLSFIFLAHIQISELLFADIIHKKEALDETQQGSPTHSNLSSKISSQWVFFWLFKVAYFIFFLILSLLSTSAVVYTIACIYTAKEITFKKVMSVVPKVWKRLMVTFIWNFLIIFGYNIVAIAVMVVTAVLIGESPIGVTIFVILCILYFMGFVYISIIWHLASVVTVLEDSCGIKAMKKSKSLIKGKMGIAGSIFLLLCLLFVVVQMGFEVNVVLGDALGVRIVCAIAFLLLLIVVILIGLVFQTVIYFVCKSYHHENIDKSSLADHLEVYLGEYVPLKAKDVQLQKLYDV